MDTKRIDFVIYNGANTQGISGKKKNARHAYHKVDNPKDKQYNRRNH